MLSVLFCPPSPILCASRPTPHRVAKKTNASHYFYKQAAINPKKRALATPQPETARIFWYLDSRPAALFFRITGIMLSAGLPKQRSIGCLPALVRVFVLFSRGLVHLPAPSPVAFFGCLIVCFIFSLDRSVHGALSQLSSGRRTCRLRFSFGSCAAPVVAARLRLAATFYFDDY